MGKRILIAEPHDILRLGLRTIFTEDTRVSHIYEVASNKELEAYMHTGEVDLFVINQSLVTDITRLPHGRFVLLTARPDIGLLKNAYRHGARGYLSENASAVLIRLTLNPTENSFIIEPTLAPWLMEFIVDNRGAAVKEELLTPREREVVSLLRSGIDRRSIAEHLNISTGTLKTHMKNIARKREREQEAYIRTPGA